MRKIIFPVIILTFLSLLSKEVFYVDYSSFKTLEDDLTRTDIYISLPIVNLEFDDNLESVFSIKLYILDQGRVIAEDIWKQKFSISDPEQKFSGAEIPMISKTALPPGYYGLRVEIEDLNSGKVVDVLEVPQESNKFMVADFPETMSFSTIQLASRIVTDNVDEKSEFFRQGAIIIPNPSKIFGTNRPFIFYYSELYGIDPDDKIEYNWRIVSAEGKTEMESEAYQKLSPGGSMAIADRILIARLKTGSYNFHLNVTNKTTGRSIGGSNNFYIYRQIDFSREMMVFPEELSTSAKDSIQIDIMRDDEILTEFEQVLSALDSKDRNRHQGLNAQGKREFLKRYWTEMEKKNPNARATFKARLKKVEADFSQKNTEGWRTDRGRIYLKMGEPNNIERETFSTDVSDHEKWYYFEGNHIFVFADIHGFGDFRLIHSDYPGERSDPNWENRIKRSRF